MKCNRNFKNLLDLKSEKMYLSDESISITDDDPLGKLLIVSLQQLTHILIILSKILFSCQIYKYRIQILLIQHQNRIWKQLKMIL